MKLATANRGEISARPLVTYLRRNSLRIALILQASTTILIAIAYLLKLPDVDHLVEAERYVSKLAASSHQLHGEEQQHEHTKDSVTVFNQIKKRLVQLVYFNDETCIVAGPITDPSQEGKLFPVASVVRIYVKD